MDTALQRASRGIKTEEAVNAASSVFILAIQCA